MAESPPAAPGRIFISYRREETAYAAGWLFDRLADRFGGGQVFKDVDSIQLGDDFVEVITNAVGSCDVLLALIGEEWLTITDDQGRRRLDDPDDFVRLEIEAALTRKVRVIPILVDGARMPRADELPSGLARLVRRQALELSPARFDFDTGRLLKVLDRTLVEVQGRRAAPEPVPPKLQLSTTAVDFGRLPRHGRSPERKVRLGNPGGGTLNAQATTQASWLEVHLVGDELVVAVDTSAVGEHQGVINVDSDGGAATIGVLARIEPEPSPAEEATTTIGRSAVAPEKPELERQTQAPVGVAWTPTDARPPVTATAPSGHAAPSRDAVGGPGRWLLWLVGGVVGVAAVIVGILVRSGDQPAAPATHGTAATTAAGPTTPRVAGVLTWKPATGGDLGGPRDQKMTSVVATSKQDARYLAGGFTTSGEGRDAGIWVSRDGRTWALVDDQDFGGPGNQMVSSVTDYGGTLLAVGSDTSRGDVDVAAWESSDGRTWQRVGASDLDKSGDQNVNRVRNTGLGMLAAGYEARTQGDVDGVIWRYRRETARWDQVSDRHFQGPGRQAVWRVVNFHGGYGTLYIAVGAVTSGTSGDQDAAVWTSRDLRTWEPVTARALGGDGDQEITDLGEFGSGLVAVGFERRDGDTRGVVWRSDDGRAWERVDDRDLAGLGTDGMLTRVFAPGEDLVGQGLPRLIVTGFTGKAGAFDGAVWTSKDGKRWAREAVFDGDGDQQAASVTAAQSAVFVVGQAGSQHNGDAAVWIGTPSP
jgi:TIR domain